MGGFHEWEDSLSGKIPGTKVQKWLNHYSKKRKKESSTYRYLPVAAEILASLEEHL